MMSKSVLILPTLFAVSLSASISASSGVLGRRSSNNDGNQPDSLPIVKDDGVSHGMSLASLGAQPSSVLPFIQSLQARMRALPGISVLAGGSGTHSVHEQNCLFQ